MLLGQLAEFLIRNVRKYHGSIVFKTTTARLADVFISVEVVHSLVVPLIALCEAECDAGTAHHLMRTFEEWAPLAVESIHRNSHMNRARGSSALNPDTADALIVDFANNACFPLDLAMNTAGLYEK